MVLNEKTAGQPVAYTEWNEVVEAVNEVNGDNLTASQISDFDDAVEANTKVAGIEEGAELNTVSNLGTGEGIYSSKVDSDIKLKSIKAGTGVGLTSDANEITINVTGGTSGVSSVNGETGIVVLDIDDVAPTQTGNLGKYLFTDGTNASWQTVVAGGGNVSKVGTPVNDQIGVWTGDGTIEGTSSLTFNTTNGLIVGEPIECQEELHIESISGGSYPILQFTYKFGALPEDVAYIQNRDTGLNFIVPTQRMFINKTTGNVGIGTSGYTPTEKLQVEGNIAVSGTVDGRDIATDGSKLDGIEAGAQVNDVTSVNSQTGVVVLDIDDVAPTQTGNSGKVLTTNGTTATWQSITGGGDVSKVGTPINNQLAIWTGDGTIEGDSNLTFDTTNGLVISKNLTTTGELSVNTNATSQFIRLRDYADEYMDTIETRNDGLRINTSPFGSLSTSTKITIDRSTGNVGIGTSMPGQKLEVNGNIATNGTVDGRDLSVDGSKLDGIETGAEVNNISDTNATDLTDGGDSTLHYHSADRSRANHTGTQTASTISDFDTEVSNNTDVAANTSARHSAVTVTDSGEIDFILTGQNITASLKASSIDETKLDSSVNASLDKADSALQPTSIGVSVQAYDAELTQIANLADPNADRILFWDDSASAYTFLTASTGLTLSGTTLTVRTTSTSQTGIVELATTAEATAGTDTTRAVTAQGVQTFWNDRFIDEDTMSSNLDTKAPSQQSVKAYVDTQVATKIANLVEDTTPQLGGNLDLNSKYVFITGQTVAGTTLGQLVYLSGANTWSLTDANAVATSSKMLGIRLSATEVLTYGIYTTTGLTAGAIYYISETTGAITTTAPTTSLSIVRIIGYALSTTQLFFCPDSTFIEVA